MPGNRGARSRGARHGPRSGLERSGLPAKEETDLARQAQYLQDARRYLVVSDFGPHFALYYDVTDDMFTMNDPTGGTLFKRRSMANAVKRLLGENIEIIECRVNRRGKLVKKSVLVRRRRGRRRSK